MPIFEKTIFERRKQMSLKEALLKLVNRNRKKKRANFDNGPVFHSRTKQKRGGHRHRPYTKTPYNDESKLRRKMAAKSRKLNWRK